MQYNTSNKAGLRVDGTFLPKQTNWEYLFFYQKSEVLYDLAFYFANTYLRKGDRTMDQMIQAARSTKQNIVEGTADGTTSREMELRLINVARASNHELLQDWGDYLRARNLPIYQSGEATYRKMRNFCKKHNSSEDYRPYFEQWTDVQLANLGLTLCHMVDSLMNSYIKHLEQDFTEKGGIKEQMAAARLGARTSQIAEVTNLRRKNESLLKENKLLRARIAAQEEILRCHGWRL